jgi:hypothetical protein
MAVFYFFGFATGMFKSNSENESTAQIQVKNIQVEPQTKSVEIAKYTFHFNDYSAQKKIDCSDVQSVQPPAVCQNEKLIYFVHDIKVHHSFISEYYFSRPPPTRS